MRLCPPLLIALVSLSAVGCNADPAVVDDDTEGAASTSDTDMPTGTSTSPGDTDDPIDTGFPGLDLGSTWEPAFECDDPTAIIPEGVECEDAIPGDQAPAKAQEDVKEAFGEHCGLERMCGDRWGVDCQTSVDGPYYYVDPETLEVIATCGGTCWVEECEDCPPEAWNCPIL